MTGRPDVEAVHLRAGVALLTNGETRPITNMIARGGLDTQDPDEAVSCVVKVSDTHWITVAVAEFQTATLQ